MPGRRGGHQREQRAEPEHRGDRRRRRRCRGRSRATRRGRRCRAAAAPAPTAPPATIGSPSSEARDEAGEHAVREALGAVGHAVEQHPAAEPAADEADERDLEEGVLHERLSPGLAEPLPGTGHRRRRGRDGARAGSRAPLAAVDGHDRAAVGRLEHRPGEHVRRPERDLAAVQAEHAVEAARLVDVVRRDQHAPPLAGEPVDERREHVGAGRVDARERLVEQHEARVLHERARDQHALALAARELAERRAPASSSSRPRRARRARGRARAGPGAATTAAARRIP